MSLLDDEELTCVEASKKAISIDILKSLGKTEMEKLIKNLEYWHANFQNMDLKTLMQDILLKTGYLESLNKSEDLEIKIKLENLDELVNIIADFKSLEDFLNYVALVNEKIDSNTDNGINLMTMHAAKGLEFQVVFLPNWQEGVFPSPKSSDTKNGLEEERRLGYVAITRAKSLLFISYSKIKYEFGELYNTEKSRFIKELDENFLEMIDLSSKNFGTGDYIRDRSFKPNNSFIDNDFRIGINKAENQNEEILIVQKNSILIGKECRHKIFGTGLIIGGNEEKLMVKFNDAGMKTIMRNFIEIL